MAGIGFELKKIYRKKHIYNLLQGIGYSTIVSIGPTIVTITIILLMYRLLSIARVEYAQRELLSSTLLYCFIFPLIVSTPFNTILSRYIADKIFQRKQEDILPSYYVGLILTVCILSLLAIPFYLRLYITSELGAFFIFASYSLMMMINIIFYSMIYLTATKDYRIITINFSLGMLLALGIGFLFINVIHLPVIRGVLYALVLGFFYIAVGEFSYIKRYFKSNSGNYKESLSYVLKFKRLFFSGLFYSLGLYIHNFVFWTSELKINIQGYISAPTYDMATYLAMLTNISSMVIFIVLVETSFHDRYQLFSEAIIRSTLRDIEKTKNDMFRLLIQQITYVMQVQAIITCIIFLLVIIFLPSFGFSGITMELYPTLAISYYVIFMMYCNIIFLCYFADINGAFFTTMFFFLGVFGGSILSSHLNLRWYGLGVFIGGMIGWSYSFFRIRYMEHNFYAHIYQKGTIIPSIKSNMPSQVVFRKDNNSISKNR